VTRGAKKLRMIETLRAGYVSVMRLRLCSLLLLVVACDPKGGDNGVGEFCPNTEFGGPPNYSVTLVGFPEVTNGELDSQGLDFEGACVLDAMTYEAGELSLSLGCDHPAPSVPEGARVTIVTAAAGLPAGVAVGDTLTFRAQAAYFESSGGFTEGPLRALELAERETYELGDESGPMFAAVEDALGGTFGPIMVNREVNCPDFNPCGGGEVEGPIRAYVHVSVGETEIDVQVGEVALLESDGVAWDLTLFAASLNNDCHGGESGGFSILRRP
jgi:hypothetical protein